MKSPLQITGQVDDIFNAPLTKSANNCKILLLADFLIGVNIMFVGRKKELELLEDAYRSTKSELVVICI